MSINKAIACKSSFVELRRQYQDLLKRFHPDNAGGNTEACQETNAEYDKLFRILKDKHESKSADSKNHQNTKQSDYSQNMYDWENDKALRDVLEKIINFDGIEIVRLIGYVVVSLSRYQLIHP